MVKVEIPINQARQLRNEWQSRLMSLKGEIAELEGAIASIDSQLNGALPGAVDDEHAKRAKGVNFRTVYEFVKSLTVNGATVAEISKGTNIPISSCVYVLKRHGEIFAKADGLWRCRPNV